MKSELIAAAGLAGLFALTGAGGNTSPRLTQAQKEQLIIHATCESLNTKFIGNHDSHAKARVKGCMMAIQAAQAVLK